MSDYVDYYSRGDIQCEFMGLTHVFRRPPALTQDPWMPRWYQTGATIRARKGQTAEERTAWGDDALTQYMTEIITYLKTIDGNSPPGRAWEVQDINRPLTPDLVVSLWYQFVTECQLTEEAREVLKKLSGSATQPPPAEGASTTAGPVEITYDTAGGATGASLAATPPNGQASPLAIPSAS